MTNSAHGIRLVKQDWDNGRILVEGFECEALRATPRDAGNLLAEKYYAVNGHLRLELLNASRLYFDDDSLIRAQ